MAKRNFAPLPVATVLFGLFALQLCGCRDRPGASTPTAPPDLKYDPSRIADLDRAVEEAIAKGDVPGAVLIVGRKDGIAYRRAYGQRSLKPAAEAMTEDTIFDLASLTKPIACATSVMLLAERGKIDLEAKASQYLPAFTGRGKENIAVRQLLLHTSGLIADNALSDYSQSPEDAIERINNLGLAAPPGSRFIYSDVGYIVLAELVQAVDGRRLDAFAREEVFTPAGMKETSFLPPEASHARSAPTETRDNKPMRGQVHDPRAHALGGVAGHAGLFGTADDVARYCQMILSGGESNGRPVLAAETVERMTRPQPLPSASGWRSYGFDIDTGYSVAPRGERFARGSTFGHTGFTGTMFWIDPHNDAFVVLLTNRVHPDGKGSDRALRKRVSTIAAEMLLGKAQAPEVRCGIDVLKRENFARLRGRRVGVVTNHTGLDRDGNRLIDLLHKADGVELVAIFSPEHGLEGVRDEKVGHGTDEKTRLTVFSLYGETRRPTTEMLAGIDTLIFDIQDIGARFYTYISTMGLCMEEAAKHKVQFMVLDRPNPNSGLILDGPIAQKSHFSFIAYGPLPVVHGMTVGELAKLFNTEYGIGCQLEVVPVEGWTRSMMWDDTGLKWVNPSPNIRSPLQALLYLSVGLLETSNLSVGRGTDQPFEVFGAPWVDGEKLAGALNKADLPGMSFAPVQFTPTSSKFAGQSCGGVKITLTEGARVQPVRSGLTMAWHLEKLFRDNYQIEMVGKMLHNDDALRALLSAKEPAHVPGVWQAELERFAAQRAKYLMSR